MQGERSVLPHWTNNLSHYSAGMLCIEELNILLKLLVCSNLLGGESAAKEYDCSLLQNEVEDNTKLEKIAQYLRDRYGCKKFSEQDMQKNKWLDQWSELYPNPTKTVLYQALIYVGEHAAARSLLPSHSQGEHSYSQCARA